MRLVRAALDAPYTVFIHSAPFSLLTMSIVRIGPIVYRSKRRTPRL